MRIKKLFAVAMSVFILAVTVISVNAETIYEFNGIKYTILTNTTVSVCGWDNSTSVLAVPSAINNRDVVEIANQAFKDNSVLTKVNIDSASKLTRIGSFAFNGCSGLSGTFTIPKKIINLGTGAFQDSGISSVIFNANMKGIPDQCFKGCANLSSVYIIDNVESIGKYAFADCPQLKVIKLSKNITSIASSAFKNDDITIQGYMDSYAEEYADSKGIDFEAIDAIVGDANYDKMLNIQDVTAIQKYKAGLTTLSKSGLKAADVTGDGEVSVRDATQIQRYLANIITDF